MNVVGKFPLLCEIILTVVILTAKTSGQGICTGVTSCYCTFENGQFLDITSLGRMDGVPRFINVTSRAEIDYSWNPCFNFTEGACHEVAICAVKPTIPEDIVFSLGYQHTAQFSIDSNNSVQITYTTQGDGVSPVRKAHITLLCDSEGHENATLHPIGQKAVGSTDYYFELFSPLACPQGTPNEPTTVSPPTTPSPSMSVSSKLLIVAGIVIVVLGVLLLLAVLKIKGKIFKKVEYDSL